MKSTLDPDIAAFQARVNGDYARLSRGDGTDVVARREVAESVRRPWVAGGPQMASTETLAVGAGQVRIRIHRPTDAAQLPALVYLHGGGWVVFSIDTHDRLMREYAARSGCAVVGIDYALAPEAPFPAALDDIAAVLAWLRDNGEAYGIDATRLAIGGDSAGANLSLASAIRDRDCGHGVQAMLFSYGAFDTEIRPSYALFDGPDYMLTVPEMAAFWQDYLGQGAQESTEPLARPMLAELSNLPPAFFCIAACDILLDENRAMAERLRQAGVAVEAIEYAGATHSFLEAVNISALADRALADAARWLRERLAP
ncbi:alpha/beta hydrolase [Stakelama sp. CBK3Z-3]|uniref:Alpha/beta hydrolase n=1 Tax=Stakelama flava TaxID=2860338 RepID=A0ABS6XK36_9SPHN|nr:alpha/beta hydrolase [Stakelama flava]MBW4330557.1 alpha/beta hydrolase [Stakelama flava]